MDRIMLRCCRGITLIEILVIIAIIAILATVSLPSLADFISRHKARQQQWQWQGFLTHARHSSITNRRWVTVCPMKDAQCVEDESLSWVAFFDDNTNGRLDSASEHIQVELSIPTGTKVIMYKGIAKLPYFRYRPIGLSGNLRGLTVCPEGNPSLAFHITSTHLGRISFKHDTNGDGIADRIYRGKRQNVTCT